MSKEFDVVLLTESRYVNPVDPDWYVENILIEDELVQSALEDEGLKCVRVDWNDRSFDWGSAKYALFRTTWDYFHKFSDFMQWLDTTKDALTFINPEQTVKWNMDKHYLAELEEAGINIPPTRFIKRGNEVLLSDLLKETHWKEAVLKPTVSGAGRETYRVNEGNVETVNKRANELLKSEDLLLQEFMTNVPVKGEVAHMVIAGKLTHSILKKAKAGDFRVQDDFGGTVHAYNASEEERIFAEKCLRALPELPAYARVDVIWDNNNQLCLSELELIEPELWFRECHDAAKALAKYIKTSYFN